jgi:hypothetical protein
VAAMKIENVKENLYVLTGSGPGDTLSGGNTAVFITDRPSNECPTSTYGPSSVIVSNRVHEMSRAR